jgi:hypothetical protein
MMAFATIRFRRTSTAIDADDVRSGPGTGLDITLVALLLLFSAILFAHLIYAGFSRF